MKINRWVLAGVGALGTAILLKIILLAANSFPFNADEAIVALMARHISQGATPSFFYGQAYMGSLDAFLIAIGFSIIAEQVWIVRFVQLLLYTATLTSTVWVGKKIFEDIRVGVLAIWFLAIPTVNVTLYTTVTLGGYGEMLLIGNLILLSGFRIADMLQRQGAEDKWWDWTIFGALAGLGLWAFGLTLIYAIPVSIYLILVLWKRIYEHRDQMHIQGRSVLIKLGKIVVFASCGILLGAIPWIAYALRNGLIELVDEMRGGAIAGVEGLSWMSQNIQHLINFLLLGVTVIFGIRPPWEIRWLALPLIPFVIFFWIAVLIFSANQLYRRNYLHVERIVVLLGVGITLILAFILTPFGADPSGRYFLPLAIILSLIASDMIFKLKTKYGSWAYGLAGMIIIFQLWGTVQIMLINPPGLTTQIDAITQIDHRYDEKLINFLLENGELHGYSNYWVAYPLAFKSEEKIIYVPRLPYHQDFRYTERDDRYEPYDMVVDQAEHVAYITTNHPDLNVYIRGQFDDLGVSWREQQIGDYLIFYALSEIVRPEDIKLGETSP